MNIISLGAGVQSTTLYLMAALGEITPKPDYAIFSDTGWEPKKVYEHVQWLMEKSSGFGIPIIITQKGNIKHDHLRALNEQVRVASMPFFVDNDTKDAGKIARQCTGEYKIAMIEKKARELLGYQPRQRIPDNSVTQWMGISLDEVQRMKDSDKNWVELRYPLIEKRMTRQDCMNWLERTGFYVPPKSSCIGCPFHSNLYWKVMKDTDPESFTDAVEFDRDLRKGSLRDMKGKLYLHRSMKPLGEIDFDSQGNLNDDLFGEDCSGVCGV